jgi:hypothetical protein
MQSKRVARGRSAAAWVVMFGSGIVAGCAGEEAPDEDVPGLQSEVVADHVLAEVTLENGNRYSFVGVEDEDGVIRDVGLIESARVGTPSIQEMAEARGLDALGVFRGLAGKDVTPPEELVALSNRISPDDDGWLADELAGRPVAQAAFCPNAWFSDRHGPAVAGWEHGWNWLDVVDPDTNVGTYAGATTSWGTEDWRSGVCIQEQDIWYDRTQILYYVKNCSSCAFVGAGSVPDGAFGEYYTYTWFGSSSKQFRYQVRAWDLFGGAAYGIYDLGLNWND